MRPLAFDVLVVVIAVAVVILLSDSSECREAIKPTVDVVKELIDEYNEMQHGLPAAANAEPCIIDVQRDLPRPNQSQPLYVVPGTSEFWLPNKQGQLFVPHGAHIELHCPHKGMANVTTTSDGGGVAEGLIIMPKHTYMLRVQCLGGTHFSWRKKAGSSGSSTAQFKQFVCQASPKYRVERLAQACGGGSGDGGGGEFYRIGYNLTAASSVESAARFVETLRVCHDERRVRTLYAQHTLRPANVHYQKFVKRLNFSKAGGFGQLNVQQLYTQRQQRAQAERLYGAGQAALYVQERGGLFLARGHLVAKADMIYASQQRSTFNYYNAAPQWQSLNGGQWAAMEEQVRRFVARLGVAVHSYTGTWGTLALEAASGEWRDFYLAHDEQNNGVLPVPALFYRVLVTPPPQRRGIALVGVNNPHVSSTMAQRNTTAYVLCADVREQVPWLQRWMKRASDGEDGPGGAVDVKKGYMYACRVDAFVKAVSDLPRELLNVSELLMAA